ncbi:hypothetical protein VNO78_18542 [Psophocarpus tetragonolobus]|uniref:Uncharacterized protein n=1 Tax=Psophocarpus tetragonolobus TaxID=3891 RepID=A0AAN9SJN0_PSOTE
MGKSIRELGVREAHVSEILFTPKPNIGQTQPHSHNFPYMQLPVLAFATWAIHLFPKITLYKVPSRFLYLHEHTHQVDVCIVQSI